jgi:hypothetical protein
MQNAPAVQQADSVVFSQRSARASKNVHPHHRRLSKNMPPRVKHALMKAIQQDKTMAGNADLDLIDPGAQDRHNSEQAPVSDKRHASKPAAAPQHTPEYPGSPQGPPPLSMSEVSRQRPMTHASHSSRGVYGAGSLPGIPGFDPDMGTKR